LDLDKNPWISFADAELLKWELVLYGTDVYVGPTGYEPSSALAERSVQPSHGALFDASSSDSAATIQSYRHPFHRAFALFGPLLLLLAAAFVIF
jgi:hypothetical protein